MVGMKLRSRPPFEAAFGLFVVVVVADDACRTSGFRLGFRFRDRGVSMVVVFWTAV